MISFIQPSFFCCMKMHEWMKIIVAIEMECVTPHTKTHQIWNLAGQLPKSVNGCKSIF
jgi:hypothetical protein